MSNFQITIVSAREATESEDGQSKNFDVTQHKRGGKKTIEKIEELEVVWDQVIAKLTDLAAKSQVAALASQYELAEIEFNIGVEAGLSVGLVTKGNASVSIKFGRKSELPATEKPAQ
ncbi:hypothetical protein [Hyphomonas sp.]|jgi:hypothetical protein|uniref:hypothetical protein n=1 Tax=Hyphomonas sp. TaxID=87 RepID=UPI0032D95B99